MKCFNCGMVYDEKDDRPACVVVCEETELESEIARVSIPKKGVLALCPFCVRAVTIGIIETQHYFKDYIIKDFPYRYIEGGEDIADQN